MFHHCSEPLKRHFLVYSVDDRGEEEEEEGGAGGTRETRDISDGPSVTQPQEAILLSCRLPKVSYVYLKLVVW